jgi:recombinational DNA repair ATPase RecF
MSRGQLKLLILLIFLSVQDFLKQKNLMRSLLMIDDLGSELDFNNLVISLREILKTN